MPCSIPRRVALTAVLLLALPAACAEEVVAAVAANFAAAMARIEPAFEQASGHQLTVVLGSSGKFLQQIQQGAPFDVFLSADAERPELLARSNLGVPASRFTYAIGRLALWSPQADAFSDGETYLKAGAFRHLAIANPAVAPYGVAAQRTLEQLGLWAGLQEKIVRAE
ncbi:MAG TPA: molybdate ABC transporter substrate-binding protein, partial [Pseudomonadales bacterium]|nr:molybdate ABC transporter substrate-binding protein [Pseudomonadales bacterium]